MGKFDALLTGMSEGPYAFQAGKKPGGGVKDVILQLLPMLLSTGLGGAFGGWEGAGAATKTFQGMQELQRQAKREKERDDLDKQIAGSQIEQNRAGTNLSTARAAEILRGKQEPQKDIEINGELVRPDGKGGYITVRPKLKEPEKPPESNVILNSQTGRTYPAPESYRDKPVIQQVLQQQGSMLRPASAGLKEGKERREELLPPKESPESQSEFGTWKAQFIDEKGRPPTTAEIDRRAERLRSVGPTINQAGTLSRGKQRRADHEADQFQNEPTVKKFNTVTEAVQFSKSLKDDTKNPQDDQALIYAFAKAMDPESVVREGEYSTVQKYAQSWIEQFGFNAKRVLSNSEFLTVDARKNLKATIAAKAAPVEKQYKNLRRDYAARIDRITGQGDGEEYLEDYGGAFEDSPDDIAIGTIAVNPQTKQQLRWDGKAWVP